MGRRQEAGEYSGGRAVSVAEAAARDPLAQRWPARRTAVRPGPESRAISGMPVGRPVSPGAAGTCSWARYSASVAPGAHRFHPHAHRTSSLRDRDVGLPGLRLGLHFERRNPGLRRLRGPRGLVWQWDVAGGLSRPDPMPRDRPRRIPDQTGSLGAVHPRTPTPRALSGLRREVPQRAAPRAPDWPKYANGYWTIRVRPSSFPPPDLPQY